MSIDDWQIRAVEYHQRLGHRVRTLKHYRCGKCRARRRLNKELWEYVRPPRCTSCGAIDWRMDLHRTKEHDTRTGVYATCQCAGYPFVHRRAGGPWCEHHPTGPTDEDYLIRFGELPY